VFQLRLPGFCVTVFGDHFAVRPAQRSKQKFKAKSTIALGPAGT
jgi:hypothetical protein